MKQTDEKGNPLTYWGGLEEHTKCYCGHTTTCDCIPEEEPKQETIEEAAEKYAKIYRCPATNEDEYCRHDIISAINFGAKWQAEQMFDIMQYYAYHYCSQNNGLKNLKNKI